MFDTVRYYVVFQADLVSADETEKYQEAHREFLARLKAEGKLYAAGRLAKNSYGIAGVAITTADSFEEVADVWRQDPYVKKKVRSLEVVEWYKRY